jgi:regulator of replication initiation timing
MPDNIPDKHFRASDVKLPSSEEEGVAALRVIKTAIANVQTQIDWAKANHKEPAHGAQIALQRWKEREDEVLYALMLLRRGESPLAKQLTAVHAQVRAVELRVGQLQVENDRLNQANKSCNLRLQEEFKKGKESRDPEVLSLREQRDALSKARQEEKRMRLEDKDFWQKKFAELSVQRPQR